MTSPLIFGMKTAVSGIRRLFGKRGPWIDTAIPPAVVPLTASEDIPEHLKVKGTFATVRDFHSKSLDNMHDIEIYLPPQYKDDGTDRYPVLYTIGWNHLYICGEADLVRPGAISEKNESIISLLQKDVVRPFIMISVSGDKAPGVDLMDECTPTKIYLGENNSKSSGGKVDRFAKFMVEEVKPYIDAHYRTLTDAKNTGITGISKWGLGTMYIAMTHPDVFGILGPMSPAVEWDNMVLAHVLDSVPAPLPLRVWMCSGELEGHYIDDMSLFRRLFVSKGITPQNVQVLVVKGADHSGKTWGPSVGPMLRFMFGKVHAP